MVYSPIYDRNIILPLPCWYVSDERKSVVRDMPCRKMSKVGRVLWKQQNRFRLDHTLYSDLHILRITVFNYHFRIFFINLLPNEHQNLRAIIGTEFACLKVRMEFFHIGSTVSREKRKSFAVKKYEGHKNYVFYSCHCTVGTHLLVKFSHWVVLTFHHAG